VHYTSLGAVTGVPVAQLSHVYDYGKKHGAALQPVPSACLLLCARGKGPVRQGIGAV